MDCFPTTIIVVWHLSKLSDANDSHPIIPFFSITNICYLTSIIFSFFFLIIQAAGKHKRKKDYQSGDDDDYVDDSSGTTSPTKHRKKLHTWKPNDSRSPDRGDDSDGSGSDKDDRKCPAIDNVVAEANEQPHHGNFPNEPTGEDVTNTTAVEKKKRKKKTNLRRPLIPKFLPRNSPWLHPKV